MSQVATTEEQMMYREEIRRRSLRVPASITFPGDTMNRIWLMTSTYLTQVRLLPHDVQS